MSGSGEKATVYVEYEASYIEVCPYCNKRTLVVREAVHSEPHIGRALLVSRKCTSCGYRRSEVIPLERKKRKIVAYRASGAEGLYAKVVRSSTALVYIPELGATIDPGVDAPLFVTNIEGLLRRVEDAAVSMRVLALDEETRKRADAVIKAVRECREGKREITVIIDDPAGLSSILPPKEKRGCVIEEYPEGEG